MDCPRPCDARNSGSYRCLTVSSSRPRPLVEAHCALARMARLNSFQGASMNRSTGALSGLRVLDLTRVLAGPFCTMMLADMGAEVIKIEQPGCGDDTRHFAPFCNGESAYYMNLNRGKQGVTLDLKA